MNPVKIKRGLKARLPTLAEGEPGFATDTKELFIGSASGNVLVTALPQTVSTWNTFDGLTEQKGMTTTVTRSGSTITETVKNGSILAATRVTTRSSDKLTKTQTVTIYKADGVTVDSKVVITATKNSNGGTITVV